MSSQSATTWRTAALSPRFAWHQLLVRRGGIEVGDVGEARHFSKAGQAVAHGPAKSARRAGDQ
jgi:hypothetical protein